MTAGRAIPAKRWLRHLAVIALATLPLALAGLARADDAVLIDWIRRTAQPFETCEPRDDQRDLASLRKIVGNAHIVALGEGTHGTREFFQLKHRIVEYLATEMGFTTFAIEANLPEAYKLNDYVLEGRGDPKALIAGMYFWTWNTEEVLAFVEWMRRFNASGRGRMQFTGFDMQKPDAAGEIVRQFFQRVDPPWADSVDALMPAIRRIRQTRVEFVTATGTFPVKDAAGHHVRYSGLIRTEDVSGYAGLWWRADAEGTWRAFDNMQGQQVAGTRGWKRYEIQLDIPANTNNINFGMLMSGTGRAWFDSLAIEIDGVPWSDHGDFDLTMDAADGPVGFGRWPGPGYSIAMDDSAAAVGHRSLRLSSLKGFVAADAAPEWDAVGQSAQRIARRFETDSPRYTAASTAEQTDWASRNAQLLVQWSRMGIGRDTGVRDSSMAANIEWIVRRSPKGSKIVLWAHNMHVARREGSMGEWLAKRYGKDMVVVGFATNEGQYTAWKQKLQANELQPGPPGSIEALAAASGIPRFLLDLRRAEPGSTVAATLASGLTMRSIGAVAMEQQFFPCPISREFDVLAWVEKTQPTRLLATH